MRHDAHTALTHDRLDQDRGRRWTDGALGRREICEWHLVETIDHWTETIEIFLLAASRERRERTAMKGAFECDDAIALGLTICRMELARRLDRALHRFGAGIAEEHQVREARR